MFISQISIENFRTFKKKTEINFHDGTNVIIGHNNAGKTTVMRALEILFDTKKSKRLSIDDFNKQTSIQELKNAPPKVTISAKLIESENECMYSDELVTVSTWLTRLEKPYEALITFEFFLPEKEQEAYLKRFEKMDSVNLDEYWNAIQHDFLKKYIHKIYVGNPNNKNTIDFESIDKFAFQFLSAIRDTERDLFTGRNTLLKEVIDFFMDYDIKINQELEKEARFDMIKEKKNKFSKDAQNLIENLQARMFEGKKHMLKYVQDTGAGFDGMNPSFEGSILDTELYSALKLIVEHETGVKIPAVHNGLGYNNLIYISLLLAKMQKDASGEYLGSNAKVFSILAIEEPEAHLHPNMQYKFLKFLKENREAEVNQIFITTHSPNITAAVDLDDIIVLRKFGKNIHIAYPGKVFDDSMEDIKSKKYVERFIDVTKADIFFAENLILVEGLAEQLLVPEFARKIQKDLTDSHTSVINIGGRYFDHFLKLFNEKKSKYAIKKKVACITDLDPVRRELIKDNTQKQNPWKSCSPLFLNVDCKNYQYKACSNSLVNSIGDKKEGLIRVFTQEKGESSTFEYELILKNSACISLITDAVSNKEEIKDMMSAYKNGNSIREIVGLLRKNDFRAEVEQVLSSITIDEQEEKKIKSKIIAGRYMTSIKKGEVAQELVSIIADESEVINPPEYIKEAIQWISQKQ
ncbi:ATP-dependent nuclease [Bacillus inaquosorum]|uniref:ATP-dependent nuclease n=1 Tax=Bacillus inaquosorum TaxID=483913 RepID=UPI0024DE8789|nr:AAA family ATPase [Bacillus inaquosorum]WIW29300.1 AAA family ATPase [Bacillus inaquosorum]